jgi:hypothetical protein
MEGFTEGAVVLNSLAGTINFEVPKKSVQLSRVFVELEARKEKLGIIDWGISNTSKSSSSSSLCCHFSMVSSSR